MLTVLFIGGYLTTVHGIIVKDPPPTGNEYKYAYEIRDPTTGDSKSQHEVRRGDVVSGSYTVLDPDGTRRTVDYTADPKTGFKAIVTQEPVYISALKSAPQSHQSSKHIAPIIFNDAAAYVSETPQEPNFETSYYHENYVNGGRSAAYFTPANEIRSNSPSFDPGKYFAPSSKYY